MKRRIVKCAHCSAVVRQSVGAINRALKNGAPIYCDKKCSGLGRRKHKTKEQKVAEKRAYDIEYRRKNLRKIKARKRAYFQRTYDPIEAAKVRKARMPLHVAYCRRPSYRRWKKRYDREHRAQKLYGTFAESFLLLQKIDHEITTRMTRHEVRQSNGIINKAQERKRAYARLVGNQFKNGPVGNSAGHQKRQDASRAG